MIDPGTAMLASAGLQGLGGLLSGGQQEMPKTYTVPGIWQQGRLIQEMVNSARTGAGEFGFGSAVPQISAQLDQMLQSRGFTGGVGGGGVGGSILANALSQAAMGDLQNRRQFGLAAAQAQPWVFQYQNKGQSPFGQNWDYGEGGRAAYDQRRQIAQQFSSPFARRLADSYNLG